MSFFAASDFSDIKTMDAQSCAERAEALLKERGTVVYGFASRAGWFRPDTMSNHDASHKALLINIEPIEEKSVKVTRAELKKAYGAQGYPHFEDLCARLGL